MGDGIQKKHALILNGDKVESRHLENVERAVSALRAEGDYQISVASDEAGLKKILAGISPDDDDLLVVYVTGHGDKGKNDQGCAVLPKGCYQFAALKENLDKLAYGRRIMVLDNCFSGGSLALFANDKTTVVTQGSEGETVSCQTFSPYFWSKQISDANNDGVISIQERYAHALKEGRTSSHTQFFESGRAISLSGKEGSPDFQPEVKTLHHAKDLQEQIKKLAPGQLALVNFSADWCGPCQTYRPNFEALAKSFNGQFLMIRAEGVRESEKEFSKIYGVKSFPTVAFIDHRGNIHIVEDREDPLKSLVQASMQTPELLAQEIMEKLVSLDPWKEKEGQYDLSDLEEKKLKILIPIFREKLADGDFEVRKGAALALGHIYKSRPPLQETLPELLQSHDPKVNAMTFLILGVCGSSLKESSIRALIARLNGKTETDDKIAILKILGNSGAVLSRKKGELLLEFARREKEQELPLCYAALAALAELADHVPFVATALLELLKDAEFANPTMQSEILRTLGRFRTYAHRIVPKLISYLNHPDKDVRSSATEALGSIGGLAGSATPALIKILREDPQSQPTHRALLLIARESPRVLAKLMTLATDRKESSTLRKALLIELRGLHHDGDDRWGMKKYSIHPANRSVGFASLLSMAMDEKEDPELRAEAYRSWHMLGSNDWLNKAVRGGPGLGILVKILNDPHLPDEILGSLAFSLRWRISESSPAETVDRLASALISQLQKRGAQGAELDLNTRKDLILRLKQFVGYSPKAARLLLEVLKDPKSDKSVALDAALVLRDAGEAVSFLVPELIDLLKRGNSPQRQIAAGILEKMGSQALVAVPVLWDLQQEKDVRVVRTAHRAQQIIIVKSLGAAWRSLQIFLMGQENYEMKRIEEAWKRAEDAVRDARSPFYKKIQDEVWTIEYRPGE